MDVEKRPRFFLIVTAKRVGWDAHVLLLPVVQDHLAYEEIMSRTSKIMHALAACALALGAMTPQAQAEVTIKNAQPVNKQLKCLTDNVYYEAGNQSWAGKLAVANVVMNRVKDSRFPNTPCGVIYQRRGSVCQFSWVCYPPKRMYNAKQYGDARRAAEAVLAKTVGDNTNGALFFHAKYVNPRWAYKRVAMIGEHVFYKG